MKKEEIYQVGDRVFDAQFGWGIVFNIDSSNYPVIVNFKSGSVKSYTEKGFYSTTDLEPALSFTEYNFVNGGFSQNREDINKHLIGKLGWFWNNTDRLDGKSIIYYGVLYTVENNKFISNDKFYNDFDNFSLECPIKLS